MSAEIMSRQEFDDLNSGIWGGGILLATTEALAREARMWRRAAHEAGAPECDPQDDRYAYGSVVDKAGWLKPERGE